MPTQHEIFEAALAEMEASSDSVDESLARLRMAVGQVRSLLTASPSDDLQTGASIAISEVKETALRLHSGFHRTITDIDGLLDLLEPRPPS